MNKDDVIPRLTAIMQDTFDNDEIEYAPGLTANDVEEWDSLSHIRLMVAVERAFKVRFTSAELEGFGSAGDLVEAIIRKAI